MKSSALVRKVLAEISKAASPMPPTTRTTSVMILNHHHRPTYHSSTQQHPISISPSSIQRGFSSTSVPAKNQSTSARDDSSDMSSIKEQLFQATLDQVPTKGFTQEAITAAVLEKPGWSLTMAGMITPSELVSHCMNRWNQEMEDHGPFESEFDAIKFRLSRISPVKSQWHNAMVLGASSQPLETKEQVHRIVELANPAASVTRQAALGVVYVATELHFLADSSPDHQDTWAFLQQRLEEIDGESPLSAVMSSVPLEASTAVARSLFDGLVSVVNPPSTYSSKIPGTSPNDYAGKSTNKPSNT